MKVKEIAEFLNAEFSGEGNAKINRVAALDAAWENEISFVEKAENFQSSNAACLLAPENFSTEFSGAVIKVKNPKLAFAKIAEKLHSHQRQIGWHATVNAHQNSDVRAAYVGAFVSIGENTRVGENSEIYDGVKIGSNVTIQKGVIIYPNCVIYDNTEIGNDCVIHAGTIIGADGFGYVRDGARGYVKFPQIGKVVIEDRVEIGANCCIDRGALGETRIGEGTKIDNLVQVAHNVQIGKRVVIASQTGISGSCVLEDDCVIGGQVGFGDHATVKTGAIIGSKAGILPGKIVREGVWWGIPVQPLDEYKRQNARVKSLARLKDEVSELKKQLAELKGKK